MKLRKSLVPRDGLVGISNLKCGSRVKESRALNVPDDVPSYFRDSGKGLFASGLDQPLGQQESMFTCVSKFNCEGIFDAQVVDPVIWTSGSQVCKKTAIN